MTSVDDPLAERRARLSARQQSLLAQRLRGAAGGGEARHAIERRAASTIAPLSYAQQRFWFLWRLDPGSTAYHLGAALRFEGALDAAALRAGLDAVAARHEALRTVFRTDAQGHPMQHILPAQPVEVVQTDLGGRRAEDRETAARALAQQIHDRPFDLACGPLLRVHLLALAERDHLLVIVAHHIICDAWSRKIILEELAALYNARIEGARPLLRELPIRYSDYAAWQRDRLDAGEKERLLAYWIGRLGREHPVLQLCADMSRRNGEALQGARLSVEIDAALVAILRRRARERGASLFMILLTAFQILLYRHSGQSDIRVGVPMANRGRPETADIVGLFVDTQILRAELDERQTLRSALDETRDAALDAQAYQDLPFECLVEALQPERRPGCNPLFQAMFNHLKEESGAAERLSGLTLRSYDALDQAAQLELALDTTERADGRVDAVFKYAAELFAPETIARLARHYLRTLEQFAEDAEVTLGALDLLDPDGRRQLLSWGRNDRRWSEIDPVHRAIERQARERPEAVAVLFEDEALSYAELNGRANRLAHRLRRLGVGPETAVGVAVERSPAMVIALLAVMKAGGAYVPLDPDYPQERLAYMAADSGLRLLLTQERLLARLPAVDGVTALALETLDLSGEPESDPDVALHGDNLVYVIYTSGSTGRPKGAANRHRALANRLAWMQEAYQATPSDTVLQKTPLGFDVSAWEVFWPLMCGARLALARPGDQRDPARLAAAIRRLGVTLAHFVPSMLPAFLNEPGSAACASLRRIVCSGEALSAELQRRTFERIPWAELVNLYGPTEAAIDVTHWTCVADGAPSVPIGRPIAGTQTYVLDGALNLAPAGAAGELYLGGEGLARGYLGRANLTAERFVADPFGGGGRLYRTGDLARWRADGQLEYLGRIDHQVKLRGLRIELGEIEAQLLGAPDVAEAAVVVRPGAGGGTLIAYVVAKGPGAPGAEALRERLARVLPDYMVPSAIVTLEALPLTPNGKLDRSALPAPTAERADHEAPVGALEQRLAAIWAEVLDIPEVGRNDNFFALGGHSMLAMQMLARIQLELAADISIADLFAAQRLTDFVARVEERRNSGGELALMEIDAFIDSLESR
jgi:amino acid adenylation domain-containing protein